MPKLRSRPKGPLGASSMKAALLVAMLSLPGCAHTLGEPPRPLAGTVDACSWVRPVIPTPDVIVKPSEVWNAYIADLRAAQAVPAPGGTTPPPGDPLQPLIDRIELQGDVLTVNTAVQIEALARMYALHCPRDPEFDDPTPMPPALAPIPAP